MARFISKGRREDLARITQEFAQAKAILEWKEAPLWNAFRQVQKDMRKEFGRVGLQLVVPKVTQRNDILWIRGPYLLPTLVLRWDHQRGLSHTWKEVRASFLIRGNEVTDLCLGSGSYQDGHSEFDPKDPEVLSDSSELFRLITGYVVGAQKQFGHPNGKRTWEFISKSGGRLDTVELVETAREHRIHYVYI